MEANISSPKERTCATSELDWRTSGNEQDHPVRSTHEWLAEASPVRIGLVLSGGGLRGASHVGVLQQLACREHELVAHPQLRLQLPEADQLLPQLEREGDDALLVAFADDRDEQIVEIEVAHSRTEHFVNAASRVEHHARGPRGHATAGSPRA
jgi:hypothetical protein